MNNVKDLKMYILIKDDVPLGHAINCAAHASLMAHLKWGGSYHLDKMLIYRDFTYNSWLHNSFKKVTCKVNKANFEYAKKLKLEHLIVTESDLKSEDKETAIVFKPQYEMPKWFNFLSLYK
jgi:peptidyl-tRNA hydrolase